MDEFEESDIEKERLHYKEQNASIKIVNEVYFLLSLLSRKWDV